MECLYHVAPYDVLWVLLLLPFDTRQPEVSELCFLLAGAPREGSIQQAYCLGDGFCSAVGRGCSCIWLPSATSLPPSLESSFFALKFHPPWYLGSICIPGWTPSTQRMYKDLLRKFIWRLGDLGLKSETSSRHQEYRSFVARSDKCQDDLGILNMSVSCDIPKINKAHRIQGVENIINVVLTSKHFS